MFVFGFFFFLSQDLLLNLELAKSARLACSQAQGTRCLWSPSTVVTGISCSTHFFQCMFHGMEHLPSCLWIMQHVTELSQSQELCFLMRTIPMSLLILWYTLLPVEWNWCISAFFFIFTFIFSLTSSFLPCFQAFEAPVPPSIFFPDLLFHLACSWPGSEHVASAVISHSPILEWAVA